MKIGILALQGAFREHREVLDALLLVFSGLGGGSGGSLLAGARRRTRRCGTAP